MGAREKDLSPDTYIGLKLPLGKSSSGFFEQTKTALEQAKYNIICLLKTIPGERLAHPTYGCGIHKLLFEPMTDDFEEMIEEEVRQALDTWLPYITIEDIKIDFEEGNQVRANVDVTFSMSYDPSNYNTVSVSYQQFDALINKT
tara:strand:+ start:44 stop:475 length:432 start_codon:yes stop_codon:yes gene_type:complete